MPAVTDPAGNVVREEWKYFPRVDVTITAGDSVAHGKAQTLQTLQALTQSQITAENWRLFAAQLDLMNLPGKQDIIDEWQRRFETTIQTPSAGGAGGSLGEGAMGIPGAQTLPLLGGAPV